MEVEEALFTPIKVAKTLEYAGIIGTIKDMSKQFGMATSTLRKRLKKGWSLEKALKTPTKIK